MRRKEIRKQRTFVNSTLPIDIDENYVFIRNDFIFLLCSKFVFFCALFFGRIFFRLIGTHKILGRNRVKDLNTRGFITIANHCHYLDGVLTSSTLGPRTIWFPSVQRNFETPYIRKFLRIIKGFPIPSNPFGLMQIMKPSIEAINRGDVIHFFPEEELWHLHQGIENFQYGAFYMAHEANCPIVPIVHLFKPRTFLGNKISNEILSITSVIGQPIYPSNNKTIESVKIMIDQAHDWMQNEMLKYKNENNLF